MPTSRRDVLKMAGLAMAGGAFPSIIIPGKTFGGINADTLKVGLVGCGGRGSGAANQALKADPNVVLYAMADIFQDKLDTSLEGLKKVHGDRVQVDDSRKFLGFDGIDKLIDSGVDVVLLASPPHFRPQHFELCVKAGKHTFCEKPMAVDVPGVKKIIEASKLAKEKKLAVQSGFCWRAHFPKRELFGKINEGAIGEVFAVYNTYETGTLWSFPRQPNWTDAEYELRNWPYYTWLSGDHIVEQAIHSIDMMSWAYGDKAPVAAVGSGGRQVRVDPQFGDIYDHFAITYEYENGAKGYHFSRQQANCFNSNLVECFGADGRSKTVAFQEVHEITGKNPWKYAGKTNDMYQTEHDELFASIRKSEPVNKGEAMAQSTLLGIMGRDAAYTGKKITWEEMQNSVKKLGPETVTFDIKVPDIEVARPGITRFS